jgi:hypothetical protein
MIERRAMTAITNQMRWDPGLDDDERTLASTYERMPRDSMSTIPWYVRLLEHPASSLALAGSVDLFGHDCIHILLGRGLLQQDEAFVLGFTMGSSGSCSALQAALFRFCARHVYQGNFRFSALDSEVFAFALRAGRGWSGHPVHCVDFREWFERPVGDLRAALGLEPAWLRSVYAAEAAAWPDTAASLRLPISS